jgi:hypothetical protein
VVRSVGGQRTSRRERRSAKEMRIAKKSAANARGDQRLRLDVSWSVCECECESDT